MNSKLAMTAIFVALVTTLAVAETATMLETGNLEQKAYALKGRPCLVGYHWNSDLHTCVPD